MPTEETLQKKQEIIDRLKERLVKTKAIFLADFSGLTVSEISELRRSLKEAKTEVKVVKNTLFRRACEGTDYSKLVDKVVGPTAVVFIDGDPIEVSKVLIKFQKATKKLALKGGVFEKELLSEADIIYFSRLPSYTEMVGMAVGAVAAPISSFVGLLNNLLSSLPRVIYRASEKEK